MYKNKILGCAAIQPSLHRFTKLKLAMMISLTAIYAHNTYAACAISANNSYEFIDNITINNNNLVNDSHMKNGDLLTLKPGFSEHEYDDNWTIWLDLNNDGDFEDPNEQIFTTEQRTNEAVLVNLDLPANLNLNNTEMRIMIHDDNVNSDSCNFNGYGDFNDYYVNIVNDNNSGTDEEHDYNLLQTPQSGQNEHIANVQFNNESHATGSNNGYADITHKTFNISDGDSIVLTPVSRWTTNWSVWVDADKNGLFDNDEIIFTGNDIGDNQVAGEINLSDIDAGYARMRIAMNGDGKADASGFNYGEIEDYTANVQSNSNNPVPPPPNEKNYGSHVQWTHEEVNVKVFKFEFTDVPLTWTDTRIRSELNEIKDYFNEQSYGQFDVNYQIHSEIITINQKQSDWHNISSNEWKEYYAQKLINLGESQFENIEDDTIYLIISPQISDFGIKAGVNPGAIRVYDTYDERSQAGGIAHEMGHAMGLHHAQGLDGQDSVFGVGNYEAERIQYGNKFSMMGNSAWDFGSFNLYYKNFFKSWNIKDRVPLISESGIYKIYALEQGTGQSTNRDIGLRIKSANDDITYWIEYRTKDGADTDGVQINVEGYFPDEDSRSFYYGVSYLLDMTPNTFPDDLNDEYDDFDDFEDGSLLKGKSFTDKWGAFTITTLDKGGEPGTPSAWVEVKVQMH
ncbi:hypothetical protein KO527_13830 [Pseudoalteromonas sp. C2R02]|uniref:GEVED domain-containing protein n=1 Tax=Pseudoalteromonas sp. C2R02 TaxID=2841565 RepID=UPI001C096284|nr:GEVED domain-containing protein [Pseudoalteromonas sp. C2R02]MBU2970428.1 hypothetical protein [Pseudoalteromonas sp. C2R02]